MKRKRKFLLLITGGVLLCLIGTYFAVMPYFDSHFFLNTTINGRNVSGMTVQQVRENIAGEAQTYVLHIQTRGEQTEETINGADFHLRYQYDDSLEELLADQQAWKWGLHLFMNTEHQASVQAEYDEKELKKLISRLSCIDPKNMAGPRDAYLSYDDKEGLCIVPEEEGSKVLVKEFKAQVIQAVREAKTEFSLEERHLYMEPEVRQDDAALVAKYNLWKPHLETKIVYHFDDVTETVDASVFGEWITEGANGSIAFDSEKIKEYVREIARKYNTAYASKTLLTSYGETVTIPTGPYGWLVNQPEEAAALEAALLNCESQDREPIYHQTAASHTEPDYGDTYVEINLSAQHLFFYKDGELLVETDFVSGNESRGWATPAGAFPLTYKERNATLKGQGYATPVSYWMPFNGNIGMHDSSWRSSYGKNIYKTNGSHGCVNLPPAVAKQIYENIEKGMPVLCYYLSGTEYISNDPVPAQPAEENPEFPDQEAVSPDAEQPAEENPVPDAGVTPDSSVIITDIVVPDAVIPDNFVDPDSTVIPDNTLPDSVGADPAVIPDSVPDSAIQ